MCEEILVVGDCATFKGFLDEVAYCRGRCRRPMRRVYSDVWQTFHVHSIFRVLSETAIAEDGRFRRVCIVGAGVIGCGVAQAAAEAGCRAHLIDIEPAALEAARRRLRRGIVASLAGGRTINPQAVLNRIVLALEYEALAVADVVIENVPENIGLKLSVHETISRIAPRTALVCCNTSAIPIRTLASAHSAPERVLGIHFMNPVPLTSAVELIAHAGTSANAVRVASDFLRLLDKTPLVVADAPGFVANRILMMMINEAVHLVEEGVAAPDTVDSVFRDCLGHAMGPLETADLIGLDTILFSLAVLQEHLGDGFMPASELSRLVAAGHLGRKTGCGFYEYGLNGAVPSNL